MYLVSRTPKDLIEPERIDVIALASASAKRPFDVHHVIPLGSTLTIGESAKKLRRQRENVLNSALNTIPILPSTNKAIGSMQFVAYAKRIAQSSRAELKLDPFFNGANNGIMVLDAAGEENVRTALLERANALRSEIIAEIEQLADV